MERDQLKNLCAWKDQKTRKPLILEGARQVGKTWLLKKFGQTHFPVFHYFNFEENFDLGAVFQKSLDPETILNELSFISGKTIQAKRDLIILDEIQREPKALTALKYFCETMPFAYVCAAGSLLGVMLNPESFPVGKVTYMDLRPMSFTEFISGLGETQLHELLHTHDIQHPFPVAAHTRLMELWKQYIIVGGLPEAVEYFRTTRENLLESCQHVRELQKFLLRAYMADMAKHSGKANSVHIEQVFQSVPAQLAKTADTSTKHFVFKNVIPGIRSYARLAGPIGWLERAGILTRVPVIEHAESPLAAQVKENIFKVYFFDTGLLGAMSRLEPAEILRYNFKTYKGFFAENFVLQELLTAGMEQTWCWEGRTSEIEFLIQAASGDILPVEVKSGTITRSKSLTVFSERYNPSTAILVSGINNGKKPRRWYIPLYAAGRIREIAEL